MPARAHRSLAELVDAEERRRRRRRWYWSIAGATIVLAAAASVVALRPRPVALAARFRTEPATHGDVVREVRATGHVEAVTTVQVGAEISGRIAEVLVDYNAVVKAGQVLARFDAEALTAQIKQALANLTAAHAALEQAKTDRLRTVRDFRRAQKLHRGHAITGSDYDNAASAARLAEQKVSAAEANLAAQKAAYNVARTNLDHSVIRSPIDGIVITRHVDPGQTVASVFQTPVLFTVAADLRKMRVIAAIDEADIGEVRVGQRAWFTVNAYPDRTFEGHVTEVRNSPVVVQDVVTYQGVIEVENRDLALKPGMTASDHVVTATSRNTMRVPAAALRFTPPRQTKPALPSVWLLRDGTLDSVPVRPGVSDGEQTAIEDSPFPPGQPLLVDLTPLGKKAYGLAH